MLHLLINRLCRWWWWISGFYWLHLVLHFIYGVRCLLLLYMPLHYRRTKYVLPVKWRKSHFFRANRFISKIAPKYFVVIFVVSFSSTNKLQLQHFLCQMIPPCFHFRNSVHVTCFVGRQNRLIYWVRKYRSSDIGFDRI